MTTRAQAFKITILKTFEIEAEKLKAFVADVAILRMGQGWYVIHRNVGYSRCTDSTKALDLTKRLQESGKLGALERQRHNARQGSYRK